MNRIVRQTVTVTVATGVTTAQAFQLNGFPKEGYILAILFELAAGGTSGNVDIKVIDGPYDASTLSPAEMIAISDAEVVYEQTGATVPAPGTSLSTNVYKLTGEASAWQSRPASNPSPLTGGGQLPNPVSSPILTVVPNGTIDGTLSITFRVRGLNG